MSGANVWLRARRCPPIHLRRGGGAGGVAVVVHGAAAVVVAASTTIPCTVAPANAAARFQFDVGAVMVEGWRSGWRRPGAVLLRLLRGSLWGLKRGRGRPMLLLRGLWLGHRGVLLVQLLVVVLLEGGRGGLVGGSGTHVTLDNLMFGFAVLGRWFRPFDLHLEAVFVLRRLLLRLLRLLLLRPAGGGGAADATAGAAGR